MSPSNQSGIKVPSVKKAPIMNSKKPLKSSTKQKHAPEEEKNEDPTSKIKIENDNLK